MNGFTSLVGNWHFWVLIAAYWVGSNAISALPMPASNGSPFYGWFFKFANGLAANVSRALAGKIPGVDQANPPAKP